MKKLTSRAYVIVAIGIVFVCTMSIVAQNHFTESSRPFKTRKIQSLYQELKRTWEDIFDRTPADAYGEFIKTANTLPYSDAHTLAHIVGAILYDREGLAGLSYCTNDFAFGCYHGFAGRVIEITGSAGVGNFAEACKAQKSATDCEHGIGHGLLAYLGDGGLVAALELCPPAERESVGGCYNGVFMEYFLNTLQRDEGKGIRPPNSSEPEGPCKSSVPRKFQPACYYELPAWWRAWEANGGAPYEKQFKAVGERCALVADSDLQTVCFEGAGAQIAPFSKYEMGRIQKLCLLMPESGRATCLEEAVKSVAGSEKRSPDVL